MNFNKLKSIAFIVIVTFPIFSKGEKVKGHVVEDQTHTEISTAMIHIMKSDSSYFSGAMVDVHGNFEIQIPKGPFGVVISNLGYQEYHKWYS